MPVVKKTVAIHPIMDSYIRKTWSILIENGYDATYSTALNFLLLGAILEATKEEGWSEQTRKFVWDFMEDEKTINELNLEDQLAKISEKTSLTIEKEERKVLRLKQTKK